MSKRPTLARLTAAIPAQQSWLEWLRAQLPPELAPHLVHVVPRSAAGAAQGTELVIFADSAAWGTRLRYALATLEAPLRERDATVAGWLVRIAPGAG